VALSFVAARASVMPGVLGYDVVDTALRQR
jgi:hypothetical protein